MPERRERTIGGVSYAPGARFRMVMDGLKLTGFVPDPIGGMRGWSQELHPGDELVCTGYGPGWGSDPGYGVEFETEQSRADGALNCDIYPPAGGVFNYHPPAGSMEPAV